MAAAEAGAGLELVAVIDLVGAAPGLVGVVLEVPVVLVGVLPDVLAAGVVLAGVVAFEGPLAAPGLLGDFDVVGRVVAGTAAPPRPPRPTVAAPLVGAAVGLVAPLAPGFVFPAVAVALPAPGLAGVAVDFTAPLVVAPGLDAAPPLATTAVPLAAAPRPAAPAARRVPVVLAVWAGLLAPAGVLLPTVDAALLDGACATLHHACSERNLDTSEQTEPQQNGTLIIRCPGNNFS